MSKAIAIVALLTLTPAQLLAWAPKGHAIVADLADSRLTPVTRKNIRLLLGDESLASVASWADDIKKDRPETFAWHFADIPKDATGFSSSRDCFRPQDKAPAAQTDHHNCVVDRIELFRQVLARPDASTNDRVEALKFLVHFVADVHQPFHDIDEGRGGNDIKVVVFGSDKCGNYPCNLHGAWDFSLIEHTGRSEPDYVMYLNSLIRKNHWEKRAGGYPEDWANESHLAARHVLEEHAAVIDQDYYEANIKLVDEQLALAGLRLAVLLNETLGKIPASQRISK